MLEILPYQLIKKDTICSLRCYLFSVYKVAHAGEVFCLVRIIRAQMNQELLFRNKKQADRSVLMKIKYTVSEAVISSYSR